MLSAARLALLIIAINFTTTANSQSASAKASVTIVTEQDLSVSENLGFREITIKDRYDYRMIASYSLSDVSYSIIFPPELLLKNNDGSSALPASLYLQEECTEKGCLPGLIIGAVFNKNRFLPPGKYSTKDCEVIINYN